MNISAENVKINFKNIYRKVHTREPFLIQEKIHPYMMNDSYNYFIFGKTNEDFEKNSSLTDFQKQAYSAEFDRLIKRQTLARNRSGNIFARLKQMEEFGYEGIRANISSETLEALMSLRKETIAALNDCQIYRICECDSGNRKTSEGLFELEKEFTCDELQRISERNASTIINTWLNKQVSSEERYQCLTKYIHNLARR